MNDLIITSLIEDLRAEGALVLQDARFELDRVHARAKMQRFRLEDPRHYVLEWVQAAHLLGATRLHIHYNARTISLRFDGEPLTTHDLTELYAAAFSPATGKKHLALKHLALGIGAAQGLDPSSIEIVSHDGSSRRRLLIRRNREDQCDEREREGQVGTSVELTERIQLKGVFKFFGGASTETFEHELLRVRCAWADIPITIDGERISHGKDPGDDYPIRIRIQDPHERGVLAISPSKGPSKLSILQHGVLISEHALETPHYTIRVIVDSDRLTRNLTSSAFVQDEVWQDFLDETITQQTHRALRRLIEPLVEDDTLRTGDLISDALLAELPYMESIDFAWLSDVAREVFTVCGDLRERGKPLPPHTRALALLFEKFRMWPCGDRVDGLEPWQVAYASMQDLHVGLEREGVLTYTCDRIRQIRHDRHAGQVLWHRPYDRHRPLQIFQRYLQHPGEDVTVVMQRAWSRKRNILAWRRREPMPALEVTRYPHSVTREVGEVRVQVALWDGRKASEWDVVKGRRLLRVHKLASAPIENVRIIWSGELDSNALFDDIARDDVAFSLLLHTVELLTELMASFASAVLEEGTRPNHGLLLDYLDALLSKSLAPRFARAMGLWHADHADLFEAWCVRNARRLDSPLCLASLAETQARQDSELISARTLLGPIARLELFERIDGEPISFEAIVASVLEHGRLAVIPPEGADEARRHARVVPMERPIVQMSPQTARILRAHLSARKLDIFDYELAVMAGRQRFLRRPTEELDIHEPALHTILLEGDHFEGRVALLSHVSQPPGRVRVRILHERRLLAEIERVLPLGQFLAVVDAELAQPTRDWKGVREDAHFDALVQRVVRATDEVFSSWVTQLAMEPERLMDEALSWLLCTRFVFMLDRADGGDDVSPEASRARDARIFKVASGQWVSRETFARRTRSSPDLFFCLHPPPEDLDSWLGERGILAEEVLVVPDNIARVDEWLGQIFPGRHRVLDLLDVDAERARRERLLEDFLTRDREELDLAGEAILSRRIADERTRGVIGLMRDPSPHLANGSAQIVLLHQSRRATAIEISLPLGRVEARFDSDDLIDWNHSDAIAISTRYDLERRVERAAIALLLELCEMITQDIDLAPDGTLHMLRSYLWRSRKSATRDIARVREALATTPLYHRADGVWVSEEDLLAAWAPGDTIPFILAHDALELPLDSEDPRAQRGQPLVFESFEARDLFSSSFPEFTLAIERLEGELSAGEVPDAQVEDGEGEGEQIEPAPSAEALRRGSVLERLTGALLEMCGEEHAWLATTLAHGLSIEGAASRTIVASASADLVIVDEEHLAMRYLLEHDDDPVALAFLSSAVYSAINLFWEEVTDSDEVTAQHRLSAALGRALDAHGGG